MLRYRNEAAFSNALVKAMRAKGWFVQRIESGQTGRGIPDIYCIDNRKEAWWLELKREHTNITPVIAISWRPGQQAWLNDVTKRGQHCLTIACFNNGIVQIPHDVIYPGNSVDTTRGIKICNSIKELIT